MLGDLGFINLDLNPLFGKINDEVIVFTTIVAGAAALLSLPVIIKSRARKRANKSPPETTARAGSPEAEAGALATLLPPALSPAFVDELIACANAKAIPVAPLKTILARLAEAEVDDTDIPARLFAAADQLAVLRASLASWRCLLPGHEEISATALSCIDTGDLSGAAEILKRGREDCWILAEDACHEEARYYEREAMIDRLLLRFWEAAGKYGCAAALMTERAGIEAWRYLMAEVRALCDDGREFDNRDSFLIAAEVCQRALRLVPREEAPREWALTKHHLGNTLESLAASGNEPELIEAAVEAYLAALDELASDQASGDFAQAQDGLGRALQVLSEHKGSLDELGQAVEAYRAALAAPAGEPHSLARAQTLRRLGDALAVLGIEASDAARLTEAVSAYREALSEMNRDVAPLDWALIQNNLGNALQALGETQTACVSFYEAEAAYRAALDGHCLTPAGIATASRNLGSALLAIAERERSNAALEKAAAAFRAALEARPAEAAPLAAAKIHMNLAYTLGALWNRTRNRQALGEALAAAEAALALIEGYEGQEDIPAAMARETILSAMQSLTADAATCAA